MFVEFKSSVADQSGNCPGCEVLVFGWCPCINRTSPNILVPPPLLCHNPTCAYHLFLHVGNVLINTVTHKCHDRFIVKDGSAVDLIQCSFII